MRFVKLTFLVAACAAFLVLRLPSLSAPPATATAPVAPDETTYQGVPPGFDFPADEAALLRLRDTGNVTEMRKHAWKVFGGLTQPAAGGEAIWETWFSGAETFRPGPSPQAAAPRRVQRNFEIPRQFKTPRRGLAPQATGASLLSFTLFNRESRAHIRANRLHQQSALTQLNQSFPAGTPVERREVPPFPREAMSLKTTWWLVKQSGFTAMPIWDFEPTRTDQAGNDFPFWKRAVAVDPARTQIPAGETRDIFLGGEARPGSRVVPLAGFYHFQISQNDIASIRRVRRFQDAQVGDYVALVAFHYTTKEIPDWVWATFWWHDRPDDGPYAADRTSEVAGVWRNYLMDVAFSMDTPREYDGTPNAAYNPWLEARFSNGMSSNCMTCHQRAVWPDVPFLPVTRGSLPPNDTLFRTRTKLDFFWSIVLESQ
jgi:hypothetical protein